MLDQMNGLPAPQRDALTRLGVSYVQRFHLAPPLTLTDLTRTLLAA